MEGVVDLFDEELLMRVQSLDNISPILFDGKRLLGKTVRSNPDELDRRVQFNQLGNLLNRLNRGSLVDDVGNPILLIGKPVKS